MRNEFSPRWAAFVTKHRKAKDWTRRQLAFAANVDPSLITLVERDGHIPLRERVQSIGRALGSLNGAVEAAGLLAFRSVQPHKGQGRWVALQSLLPSDALAILETVATLSKSKQLEGLTILQSYADAQARRMARSKQVAHA